MLTHHHSSHLQRWHVRPHLNQLNILSATRSPSLSSLLHLFSSSCSRHLWFSYCKLSKNAQAINLIRFIRYLILPLCLYSWHTRHAGGNVSQIYWICSTYLLVRVHRKHLDGGGFAKSKAFGQPFIHHSCSWQTIAFFNCHLSQCGSACALLLVQNAFSTYSWLCFFFGFFFFLILAMEYLYTKKE